MTFPSNRNIYKDIVDNLKTGLIPDELIKCSNCLRDINRHDSFEDAYCSKACSTIHNRSHNTSKLKTALKIPKRYRGASFESFETKSNIVAEIKEIIDSGKWEDPILFTGNGTGCGKTHLAICTIVEMARRTAEDLVFINFSDLMGEIFASIKDSANGSVDSIIRKYSNVFILCIDDLGAEHTTAYSTSVLYRILNNRYNSMKATIVTTNLSGDEICESYDKRIFSRMICGHVFTLSGKDKRKGIYKKVNV